MSSSARLSALGLLMASPTLSTAATLSVGWSAHPDRTSLQSLQGAVVGADIYVVVTPDQAVSSVTMALDGQVTSDTQPPYDLEGDTGAGQAAPLDTFTLENGAHRLQITATTAAGQSLQTVVDFEVDNRRQGPAGLGWAYAQTTWPSLHRDQRNVDYTPFQGPERICPSWTALQGDAVVTAVTTGPEGNLYVTTGREAGHSNLHVFDRDGNLRWASPPVTGPSDLDGEAIGSSVVIDREGDAYVADDDQLWAWHPDGQLKWVVPISDSFITVLFTRDGHIVGVNSDGDVELFHREDGSRVAPPMTLPPGENVDAPDAPPGLWEGMMDPAIIFQTWAGLLGMEWQVTNTPALDLAQNRLFIVAAGADPGIGVFYGVDLDEEGPSIAFATPIGPFSATSPAVSLDGLQAYVTDGEGVLYAIDTTTGDIVWEVEVGGSAGSPSVGPDNSVYSLSDGQIAAYFPDGAFKWRADFDALAERLLPTLPSEAGAIPPISRVDSVVSLTSDSIYVAVLLGYEIQPPDLGSQFFLVERRALVRVEPTTGAQVGLPAPLPDSPENVVSLGLDGQLYIGMAAVYTSVTWYSLNADLPPFLQIDPPVGGIAAFEPCSWREQVEAGVGWMDELASRAQVSLSWGRPLEALSAAGPAWIQAAGTLDAIRRAQEKEHLLSPSAQRLTRAVEEAQLHLRLAWNQLYQVDVSGDERWLEGAAAELALARAALGEAGGP